ncbi:LANO_0C05820g1_1 [Lachancea nothofagi CBS 11611]|uniref:LANO_0C05820g1_1 n=1 Tax=Lachancea nothofagi CBS 11611 TaxID=1266666 RepID=A0A1G4J7T7_9SACH|nr:LANO_0C05820g1_1 [Lachancea nothofagi CBS 11611]
MTVMKPRLKRSLSSLSSQINESRESTSPRRSDVRVNKRSRASNSSAALPGCNTARQAENSEWHQKYQPQELSDLVLHKRKLQDVRNILEPMVSGESSCRILLLTGPAGCAKSTCIKLLAEELISNRVHKPSGLTLVSKTSQESPYCIEYDGSNLPSGVSKTDHFDNFLTEARYRTGPNLAVLLAEDLPNVFHQSTRTQFQQALLRWLYSSQAQLPPLVICLTECELQALDSKNLGFSIDTHFIAETVLGFDNLIHPRLQRIKFNPINKTLLKKHLNDICVQERHAFIPGKWEHRNTFISNAIQNCGDIRSSTSALQLWATTTGSSLPNNGTREHSISYFQGLGRIMYGSKEICDDNQMINQLVLSSSANLGETLKLGLLENYAAYNKQKFPVSYAMDILDALSLGDTMSSDSSMQDLQEALEYPLRVARRKLSELNGEQSLSHSKPNFPRESKVRKLCKLFVSDVDNYSYITMQKYNSWHTFRNIALHFGFFAPLIRKHRNYKKKALNHHLNSLGSPSERCAIIEANASILAVDEEQDVLKRIGGDLSLVNATQDFESKEKEDEPAASNSKTLAFLRLYNKNSVSEGIMDGDENDDMSDEISDPIVHSEDGDDDSLDFSDEDDTIYDILASQSPRKPGRA